MVGIDIVTPLLRIRIINADGNCARCADWIIASYSDNIFWLGGASVVARMLSEPKSDFSDYIFSIIIHIIVAGVSIWKLPGCSSVY